MLEVQKYLENHSFKELAENHGVYASFSKSGQKFSLNYDQIEAKDNDPIVHECRGLILSADDGRSFLSQSTMINNKISYNDICPGKTKILAFGMRRFFNYGQGCAANIDWNDPKLSILEKLDGTLCICYYDIFINQWCIATRSVPEADLLMDNGLFTFRTLFEKALKDTTGLSFEEYTSKLDKEITYSFELTTPYNRIVVNYPENRVTLLAARRMVYANGRESFEELDINTIPTYGVPCVRAYAYMSINDLVDWVSTLNPMQNEGVVVRDGQFNRIKIKNANYIAFNKLHDRLGTSERNCLEIILQEKDDDVIPFLPEDIVKNLLTIKNGLQIAIKQYDDAYLLAKSQADAIFPGDKKTFAILVISSFKDKGLWSSPFFEIFAGKSLNMKDFIVKNRKEGTWSNSFLDKLLEISKS